MHKMYAHVVTHFQPIAVVVLMATAVGARAGFMLMFTCFLHLVLHALSKLVLVLLNIVTILLVVNIAQSVNIKVTLMYGE